MKFTYTIAAIFGLLAPMFAQTALSGTLTTNSVYEKSCAKCHGKKAEGRHFGGPSLIGGEATTLSADDLRSIITNGKGHMPKYSGKLSFDEINDLVRQIRAAAKR